MSTLHAAATAPYGLRLPAMAPVPLVVSIPHTGTWLPPEVEMRLASPAMRAQPMTDWHLHLLYDFLPDLGATTLHATVSRFAVDLNRPPEPRPLYPGRFETGLVPLQTFQGEPVFGDPPTTAEVEAWRNAWHAPYALSEGQWPEQGEVFADRCVRVLSDFLPDIGDRIVARSFLNPRQLEAEFGLLGSNITHGEMMPGALFGARPGRNTNDYRSSVPGLYLSGAGTWPGGYVTGLPGFNAANVVINDFNKSR